MQRRNLAERNARLDREPSSPDFPSPSDHTHIGLPIGFTRLMQLESINAEQTNVCPAKLRYVLSRWGHGWGLQRRWWGLLNLAGPVSIADFAMFPHMRLMKRVNERQPGNGIAEDRIPTKLADWMKRIEALPYYHKTIPPHWKQ